MALFFFSHASGTLTNKLKCLNVSSGVSTTHLGNVGQSSNAFAFLKTKDLSFFLATWHREVPRGQRWESQSLALQNWRVSAEGTGDTGILRARRLSLLSWTRSKGPSLASIWSAWWECRGGSGEEPPASPTAPVRPAQLGWGPDCGWYLLTDPSVLFWPGLLGQPHSRRL